MIAYNKKFSTVLGSSLEDYEAIMELETEKLADTKALFVGEIPYEILTNIFDEKVYEFNSLFIEKIVSTLNTGWYDPALNKLELHIAKDYIAYKYSGSLEPTELIIALDEKLGAL